MKILLISVIFLFIGIEVYAQAPYTEFFVDPLAGLNTNSGDGGTLITDVGGSWNSVVSSYTASSGTPFSGVVAGQFASIYLTGASSTSFIARINSVGGGGSFLLLSSTNNAGTVPLTGSAVSASVGGKFQGPNLINGTCLPFGFLTANLADFNQDRPRVNFINSAVYVTTQACTNSGSGVDFWGYTNTPGDGGYATISDANPASVVLLTLSGSENYMQNLIFQSTATSGSANMITLTGARNIFYRDVLTNARGDGIASTGIDNTLDEVEAYGNNRSNTGNEGGISSAAGGTSLVCIRVNSHDNLGSNSSGFFLNSPGVVLVDCIAKGNGANAIFVLSGINVVIVGGDYSGNGTDAVRDVGSTASLFYSENANFTNNGGFALNFSASMTNINRNYKIRSNGFFSNTSGIINNGSQVQQFSTFTYTTSPYFNLTTGDLRLKSGQALGTGEGSFTVQGDTVTSLQAYPDIGAVQSKRFPGGAYSFSN